MEIEVLPNKAGAILHGLDLGKPLTESAFEDIYSTYLRSANIVITGQTHISSKDYVDFCGRFGKIIAGVPSTSRHKKYSKSDVDETEAPKYTLPGYPEIFVITNLEHQGKPVGLAKAGLYWHSDLYYMAKPSKVTFLFGKNLPTSGGDTMILNTYEVFGAMPKELKERIKNVWMHHSWTTGWPYSFPDRAPLSPEECETTPDVKHPLVGCHPETGRPFLYPGALYHFDNPGIRPMGLSNQKAAALYQDIKDFTLNDRFIYRHKWRVGDILATDNLAGMHCATDFDNTELRMLHRVTIEGVAPACASDL